LRSGDGTKRAPGPSLPWHAPCEVVVFGGIFRHNRAIGAAAVKHAADRKAEGVQAAVFERGGEHVVQDEPAEALKVRADHADRWDQALD